jgi:hypothetical protein
VVDPFFVEFAVHQKQASLNSNGRQDGMFLASSFEIRRAACLSRIYIGERGKYGTRVLALKSGYHLDGEEATLISAAVRIRILAYAKARGRF